MAVPEKLVGRSIKSIEPNGWVLILDDGSHLRSVLDEADSPSWEMLSAEEAASEERQLAWDREAWERRQALGAVLRDRRAQRFRMMESVYREVLTDDAFEVWSLANDPSRHMERLSKTLKDVWTGDVAHNAFFGETSPLGVFESV